MDTTGFEPPKNTFTALQVLDNSESVQDDTVANNLAKTKKLNPDHARKILHIEKMSNISGEEIEKDITKFDSEFDDSTERAKEMKYRARRLHNWVASNPYNAASIKDDLPRYVEVESKFDSIANAWERGRLMEELSDLGFKALYGKLSTDEENRVRDIQMKMRYLPEKDMGFFEGIPEAVAEQIPLMWDSIKSGLAGAGLGFLVGGPGGAALGGKAGAGIGAAMMEAGLAFMDYRNIQVDGQPIDIDAARGAAVLVGIANGALELVGFSQTAKALPALRGLSRQGLKEVLKNASRKKVVMDQLKKIGLAILGEGGTEFVQELITGIGANALGNKTLVDWELINQATHAAKKGAQAGFGFSLGGTATTIYGDVKQAKIQEQKIQTLIEIKDQVAEIQENKTDPVRVNSILEQINNSETEYVYVDTEVLETFYQEKKGVLPGSKVDELSDGESNFEEAKSKGHPVKIKTSKLVQEAANDETITEIFPDIKFSPEEQTSRETREYISKEKAEAIKNETVENAKNEAELQALENRIYQRAENAVMPTGMARAVAQLYRSTFRAISSRTGISVEELNKRYTPNIIKDGFRKFNYTHLKNFESPVEVNHREAIPVTEFNATETNWDTSSKLENTIKEVVSEASNTKTVQNIHMGQNISLDRLNASKVKKIIGMLEGSPKNKNALMHVLTNLQSVLENAEYVTHYTESGTKDMHVFQAPIRVDGKYKMAKFIVEKTGEGLSLDQIEINITKDRKGKANLSIDELYENISFTNKRNKTYADPKQAESPLGPKITLSMLLNNIMTEDVDKAELNEILSKNGFNQQDLAQSGILEKINENPEAESINKKELLDFIEKDAYKEGVFFQEGANRGAIEFRESSINIVLGKDADMSTFIHETGHLFFKILFDMSKVEGASKTLLDDVQTIIKEYGITDPENITREQNEMFAEQFERYIEEGKAPTTQLEGLFRTFRRWLTAVYANVFDGRAKLNDKIRGVMDRLVAVEEEIQLAQEMQNMGIIKDLLNSMPKAKRERFEALLEKHQIKAEKKLTRALLRDIIRKENLEYRIAEQKTIKEVAELLSKDKVLGVRAALTNGQLYNKTKVETKALSGKIVKQFYGAEVYEALEKQGYRFDDKAGINPDILAKEFNFKDGQEMVEQLLNVEHPENKFQRLVKEKMDAKFPNFFENREMMKSLAMEYVHTDMRSEMLALELEELARNLKFSDIKTNLKTIKREAIEEIERTPLRYIKPLMYLKAERKYAKQSLKLFEKRGTPDLVGAYEAKRKELINHELFREATRFEKKVESNLKFITKFTTEKYRREIAKTDRGILEQIDGLLNQYDLKKSTTLTELAKRQDLRTFLANFEAEYNYKPDVPQEILDRIEKISYKEIPLSEFMGVIDSLKMLDHIYRNKRKFLAFGEKLNYEAVVNEITTSIKSKFKGGRARLSPHDDATTLGGTVKTIIASHMKMSHLTRVLDGGEDLGVVNKYIYQPLKKASDAEIRMNEEVNAKLEAILDKYFPDRKSWHFDNVKVDKDIKGLGGEINKTQLLTIAYNWGNFDNKRKLLKSEGWTEAQVQSMLSKLSDKELEGVQATFDFLDEYFWPKVKALEEKLNGIAPEKVEALPFTVNGKTYRGGYYPVIYSTRLDTKAMAHKTWQQAQEIEDAYFARAMTRHGHTIERVEPTGMRVSLNITGLSNHMTNVVHDLTHREAIIDVNKIIKDSRVEEAVTDAIGREAFRQINPWLKNIAVEEQTDISTGLEGILSKLRKNATIVNMGLKFTTALVQPLGLLGSMKEVGTGAILKQFTPFRKNPAGSTQDVMAKSAMMRHRIENWDRDIRDKFRNANIQDYKPSKLAGVYKLASAVGITPTNWGNLTHSYFSFIGLMDKAVAVPTWKAAYNKAIEGKVKNIDVKSPNLEELAIQYADQAVEKSQGSGGPLDLARIQRGTEGMKLFTMFYSYFSMVASQYGSDFYGLKDRKNYKVSELVATMAFMWFGPAVLESFLLGRSPIGDENAEDKDWVKWYSKIILYPGQSVVGLRDVLNATDGYGYTMTPGAEGLGKLADLYISARERAFLDKDEFTSKDYKNLFLTVGYLGGLPTRQLYYTANYLMDYYEGEQVPETAIDFFYNALVGKRAFWQDSE